MLKYLFDLSYEKTLEDAFVFYFCYVFLGYFIAGSCFCLSKIFYSDFLYLLIFFVPFIFYTSISIGIILKKKIKDIQSVLLVLYTVVLTLLFPVILVLLESFVGFYVNINEIAWGIFLGLLEWFFPGLILGGIPVAILTMKEDNSLEKEIRQMEQEKFEHEHWIEKQLLTERANKSKLEEIEKHLDNENKKEQNEI